MTDNIIPLRPGTNPASSVPARPKSDSLSPGRLYSLELQGKQPPGGMVGNYLFDEQTAELAPTKHENGTALGYVYDTDAALASRDWSGPAGSPASFAANCLTLESSELIGPQLEGEEPLTTLSMQAQFSLLYDTDAYAAELGVIHLVQSQRFVTLADGKRFELLEAEEPVLYLGASGVLEILGPAQPHGSHQNYPYTVEIQQAIPTSLAGVEVETVTVLEQYWSFFMQREASQDEGEVIWIPALAPVTWGWSIRVGRRADHEWGIVRRKLILPTLGHDGLEFPLWEDNQKALSQPLPA